MQQPGVLKTPLQTPVPPGLTRGALPSFVAHAEGEGSRDPQEAVKTESGSRCLVLFLFYFYFTFFLDFQALYIYIFILDLPCSWGKGGPTFSSEDSTPSANLRPVRALRQALARQCPPTKTDEKGHSKN